MTIYAYQLAPPPAAAGFKPAWARGANVVVEGVATMVFMLCFLGGLY